MNIRHTLFLVLTAVALLATPMAGRAASSQNWEPAGIAFDHQGNLFVADHTSGQILKFAPDGTRSVFAF